MRLVKALGYALVLPVLLILLWWSCTLVETSFYVPEPVEFATTFVDVRFGERFFEDVLPSIGRLPVGLALSILLGVVAGLVTGSVRWLRKTYQSDHGDVEAVRDLTYDLDRGELACLVGPSGSGKTTLLTCIPGLMAPTSGEVLLGGEQVTGPPKDMAVVLEDLVRDVWHRMGVTVLFVTYDIDESVYLGERVSILSSSPTVVQEDLPIDLPDDRDQLTTRGMPRFTELRGHVYEEIRRAEREAGTRA